MASLVGQQLKDTYDSLLKTSDNDALGGTYKEITDGAGNGSGLYLGTGKNIGIGISSPNSNGGANATILHIHNPTVGNWSGNHYTNGTTGSNAGDGLFVGSIGADSYILNYESSNMLFYTASTEAMRIDSSGNVGIGTTSPSAVLHVNSNSFPETNEKLIRFNAGTANYQSNRYIEISNSFTGAGYTSPALVFKTNADASNNKSYGLIATLSDGSLSFQNKPAGSEVAIGTSLGTTERMRIDSSGNVEINGSAAPLLSVKSTASGTPTAFVYASTNGADFGSLTNHPTRFYVNNGEKMRIDSSGNLLIGTTATPTASAGNIVLKNGTAPTGNATDGVILYAEDFLTSSELKVRDEAGNVTTLSPHNFSLIPNGASEPMAWAYYSERDGKKINVDMLKLARMVESLTGEKLVYEQ